jgi:hypothetical protein
MIDTFQINKLSDLHNGNNIFFCKRDYIFDEFKLINELSHDVILIVGNSDYVIDDNLVSQMPKNIKFIFSPNNISKSNRVISLPLGLDNCNNSFRGDYHGIGYGNSCQEYNLNQLSEDDWGILPTNFIYSNFNIMTNFEHRSIIKNICSDSPFIDVEFSNISTIDFYRKILSYQSVVCPSGNGPDTHRFYETLYLKRIPIVFNQIMYNNLYKNFPCLLINDLTKLFDYNYLNHEIHKLKNQNFNLDLLTINYWKNKILSSI